MLRSGLPGALLLMLGTVPAFPQGVTPATAPSPVPPVIDEKTPPPFDEYMLGPDSLPHPSVPVGKVFRFELTDSKVYPGTSRIITVYVPASYKGDKPACVYVGLDGLGFEAPAAFDNLIAQGTMPVTIGIGVSPGTVKSANAEENPRFDRSLEFDSLNGRLGRFLLAEVLPEVEMHRTPDGLPILLSKDANDRAIGGTSTGGIGAFTVAWEHPDAFRRVFSAIGTYVGMRGGEQYYVTVRKTEPKPLRVFMEDGVHDEWLGGPEMGDWWMSNQTMERALEFGGYEVRHVWGAGTHNGSHAAALFPDAMKWLWKDWPIPIRARESNNPVLRAILNPDSSWELAATDCAPRSRLAANAKGEVLYADGGVNSIAHVVSEGDTTRCQQNNEGASLAFGPDETLYRALSRGGVAITQADGNERTNSQVVNLHLRGLTVRSNGDIYATAEGSGGQSELWLIRSTGEPLLLAANLKGASGVALSPDGLWLFVAQAQSRSGMSYRVRSDGTVDDGEPFYHFVVPDWVDSSGAADVAMDRDGRSYAATSAGVQVFDRNGRVTAILPLPGNEAATGVSFGGREFDTLYVAAGDKIYRRKLHVRGAPAWAAPIVLPHADAG